MWWKTLYFALKRNGWQQLFFYLSNLDIWRFMEYSRVYEYVGSTRNTGKIVDLGGGYSVFPCFFQHGEYVVVDLSEGACRYQKAHGTKAVVSDMTHLPFESSSVPTVIAISSIEHVPDDGAVFREIARVLTDNGIAAITLPFSKGKTEVTKLRYPTWQVNMLYKFKKQWQLLIGETNLQYFMEQMTTDAIMKHYSLADLQETLKQNGLSLIQYELIGKKLIKSFFRLLLPGWFVVKDILIGWPLYKLEKLFYKNSNDASGIILKIKKKQA